MQEYLTKEKYYRQNGTALENAIDIESVKRQQHKDVVRNARLGTYNKYGRYVIPPAIISELLGMTKYIYEEKYNDVIKESKDTFEFQMRGFLPVFGQIEFRLVVKDKTANLYILENVYREFDGYQEIFGEQISETFCATEKSNLIENLFTLYNVKVVREEDINGKKPEELTDDPESIQSIMYLKMYLVMSSKQFLKISSKDEKETFENIVGMLKDEGGEYGKKVLKHFIDRIEKRPDIMQVKDEDGYNESLNDVLIGALEVATTEDDMLDPGIQDLYRRVYKERYDTTDKNLEQAEKEVMKDNVASLVASISGGKKSTVLDNENISTFDESITGMLTDQEPEEKREESPELSNSRQIAEAVIKGIIAGKAAEAVVETAVNKDGQTEEEVLTTPPPTQTAGGPTLPKGVEVVTLANGVKEVKKQSPEKAAMSDIWSYKMANTNTPPEKKKKEEEKKQGGGGGGAPTPPPAQEVSGQDTITADPVTTAPSPVERNKDTLIAIFEEEPEELQDKDTFTGAYMEPDEKTDVFTGGFQEDEGPEEEYIK